MAVSRAGEREWRLLAAKVEFHGAADPVEALAVALGAEHAGIRDLVAGFQPELPEPVEVGVAVLVVGHEHPRENAAVSAAGRTPAAG